MAGALFLPQRAHSLILGEKRLVECREGERHSSLASFMCMSALLEKSKRVVVGNRDSSEIKHFSFS